MPTKMVLRERGRSVDSLETGVASTRRLVSDPALASTTGRFFDRTRETRANPQAYDPRPASSCGIAAWNSSVIRLWTRRTLHRSAVYTRGERGG